MRAINRQIARNVGSRGKSMSRIGILQTQTFPDQKICASGLENMPSKVPCKYTSAKLLITNLDIKVNDNDICELFSEIGIIREACVHYNCWGYSLGTAHVVYLNPEHAAEAARRYNGIPLDGKPMTITLEGSPYGSQVHTQTLPVKLRLSFGPNHQANGASQTPLSLLNRRGGILKTPKRLANGVRTFMSKETAGWRSRGRSRQGGKPAVDRSRGPVLTAAELDLELEEYLKSKAGKENKAINRNEGIIESYDVEDDFGEVKDIFGNSERPVDTASVLLTPKNTPGKVGRPRKTPGSSRNTPARKTSGENNKTPTRMKNETPAKTASVTPAKSSKKTPAKTPLKTPGKTAKRTPAKTPRNTPAKTSNKTPKNASLLSDNSLKTLNSIPFAITPNVVSANTISRTPARVTGKAQGKTPGKVTKQRNTPNVNEHPSLIGNGTPRRSGRVLKSD